MHRRQRRRIRRRCVLRFFGADVVANAVAEFQTDAIAIAGTYWHADVATYAGTYGYADIIADAGAEFYANLCADGVATSGAEFQHDVGAYACTDFMAAACPRALTTRPQRDCEALAITY